MSVDVNKYYVEINKYKTLKSALSNVSSSLKKSSEKLGNTPNEILKLYSINEENTLVSNKIKLLNNDIIATANHINNTICPAIDNAIYSLRRKIEKALAEEES